MEENAPNERLVLDDNKRAEGPNYGVRLTGDELAQHQQRYRQPVSGSEYGPQGPQPSNEYGPQMPQGNVPPVPGGYQASGAYGGPQLHPEMTQEPKRPKTLNISFWAIVAAGLSYLVSKLLVVALPNRGISDEDINMLESMMGSMQDQLPYNSMEAYLNSSLMTATMIGQAVIFFVAYVLVGLGIRNGWRSMRILGTVFAVLSLFNLSLASPLVAVFTAVSIILGIVGIVYAWLPASTEYYRQKAWQKAAKKIYPNAPSR